MSDLNQDVCPICNFLDTENFYDYGLFQFPTWKRYLLNLICKNCGQVFLSKNSAYNEIDDYYADYNKKLQPEIANVPVWFQELCTSLSKQRYEFFKDFLRNNESFLDIGCGYGSTLGLLKSLIDKKNF